MPYKILTYEQIDKSDWSRLVASSATGTWFQAPEAYSFYESMSEIFMPFVVAVACDPAGTQTEDKLTLRAICCGYVTKELSPFKQYFTRRAIIIGGPVIANDATNDEVGTLMKAVRNQFGILDFRFKILNYPIYIETRNFNDYSRWRGAFEAAGFSYQPHLNFHVDCTDEEAMWERLSENRKRQIKKVSAATPLNDAAKLQNDVPAELNDAVTEADIIEWYAILAELYRTKVKTPLWPVEFFLEAHRQGVGKFMLVRHEEKIIGGSMVVTDGKAVYEWFECGMNTQYKEQYPSVMATWAGMSYAAEHACARYDMMGAGVPGVPYGVRDFKSEFGGELVEHGRFLCVCKPLLYKLGVLGVKILRRK